MATRRVPSEAANTAEPAVAPTKPAGRPYVTRVGQYDDRGKFVGANSARLVATKPLDADSATEAEMLARAAHAPKAHDQQSSKRSKADDADRPLVDNH